MKQGHLFLICGPSGVGKSTAIKHLTETNENFIQIPSHTTRPVRSDDKETNARIHVSKPEFDLLVKQDAFVDWVEFSHHLYGKKKSDIQKALGDGKVVLIDIDSHGIKPYKDKFPDSTLIFMKYRSLEDLKERLRKARPDSTEEELERRHQIAKKEMETISGFDFVVTTLNNQSPIIPAQEINEIVSSVLADQQSKKI